MLRDQPPARFPASRFEALRDTSAGPDGSPPFGAPMFACHKSHDDATRASAGWLAVAGHDHVMVRLAAAYDRLPVEALRTADGWPALYASYEEMATANGATFT